MRKMTMITMMRMTSARSMLMDYLPTILGRLESLTLKHLHQNVRRNACFL